MLTGYSAHWACGYAIHVAPEETTDGVSVYVARHPELPGCMAHGETPDEAVANLAEARTLYLQDLRDRGLPIPDPKPAVTVAVWESSSQLQASASANALSDPQASMGAAPQVEGATVRRVRVG
jgi:predicted RNase H-like HicB family nuclease